MVNSNETTAVSAKQVLEQIENYEGSKPLNIALPMALMSAETKAVYKSELKAYKKATGFGIFHAKAPVPPEAPTIQIGGSRRKKHKRKKHTKQVSVSQADREEQISAAHVAMEVVAQRTIRRRICAALQAGTNDAFEIGKVLTPILLPLSLAGTIAIPPTPIALAAVSLIVARIGVAAFCAGRSK